MPPATVTIASGSTWQEVAADRQAYRDASIARLTPALPDIPSIPLNAIPLAKQILTAAEVKITETTVEELVPKLATGELKATDVVKAFLRRAGVAQRAVGIPIPCAIPASKCRRWVDKLRDRTTPRKSSAESCIPRYLPFGTWQTTGTITWPPNKCEGTFGDERL